MSEETDVIEDVPSIPGYTLLRTIGQGGAGTVYEALAADDLGRRFAIKVFPSTRRREYDRELATLRAIEDARAAAGSQDLIETIAAGETEGGLTFVVMAYAAGGDLQVQVRDDGPLSPEDAVAHLLPVLRGLELLHLHGLVHKDVKPANVMVGQDGQARLGDFGLTRALGAGPLSSAGTPGFCAPELITGRGDQADGRLDVYSATATLYFLLTAEAPLPGRPDLFLLERRRVDRGLQGLLFRGLALEPERRPGSPAELRQLLESWQRGELKSGARPVWPWVACVGLALAVGVWLQLSPAHVGDVSASRGGPGSGVSPVRSELALDGPLAAESVDAAPVAGEPGLGEDGTGADDTGADDTGDASGTGPRWDGYELCLAGPKVSWEGGTLVVPERPAQELLSREPLARARSAGGTVIAAACDDGETVVVDLDGSDVLRLPAVVAPGTFPSLAVDADHVLRVLAFADLETEDRLELFDRRGKELVSLSGIPVATAAALLPRPGALPYAALGTPDGRVVILDLAHDKVVLTLRTHADEVLALAVEPQRGWLLVLGDARELNEAGELSDEPQLQLKAYPLETLLSAGQPDAVFELPADGELVLPR